jgi:hypothetical protein
MSVTYVKLAVPFRSNYEIATFLKLGSVSDDGIFVPAHGAVELLSIGRGDVVDLLFLARERLGGCLTETSNQDHRRIGGGQGCWSYPAGACGIWASRVPPFSS